MPNEKQALMALDEINQILRRRVTDADRGIPHGRDDGMADLAADYLKIRSRLDTALTLIDKIPVYGREIGGAVRFLIQVSDRACAIDHEVEGAEVALQHSSDTEEPTTMTSKPLLFHIGHTSFRAQTRRREAGTRICSPSADGSLIVGVF